MGEQNNMADIYFYHEDVDEDSENGFSDSYNHCDNQDDGLGPIAKLEKYAASENIFNRQMVARTVLDNFRVVGDNSDDIKAVFQIVLRLSQDVEPSVRAELMEQVPHIAMYCHQYPEHLHQAVPLHLLPLVVTFLTDTNNQVRKTSQAALLVLLEQGLVDAEDVEDQVCPVILRLTASDSMDDYRTEAVALLSKMAPLVGQEMCVRLFLNRFATLCSDPLFHVRKVCAANFGDFSGVVGPDSTEETLCPVFYSLCEDSVWGVRKACADVFMPVSCVCSPQVRKQALSPLFINLLRDQSRWVRMAAFQALGPFISTFADPAITALLHNENGEIVITDPDQLAERLNTLEKERASAAAEEDSTEENSADTEPVQTETDSSQKDQNPHDNEENNKNNNVVNMDTDEDSWEAQLVPGVSEVTSPEEMRAEKFLSSTEEYNYSSFLYWRDPVPSLQLTDVDLAMSNIDNDNLDNLPDELLKLEMSSTQNETKEETDFATDVLTNKTDDDNSEGCDSSAEAEGSALELGTSSCPGSIISTFDTQWSNNTISSHRVRPRSASDLDPPDPSLPKGPPLTKQTIVPQLLVDHYVSMTDPSRAQTVDNDIARHCAFSFPAVALTLGRANWPLLRDTYEILANDMQWKVRRTLASSIHELGVILGQELSTAHLVPIFNGFIKDLDEVRIGILKHLADFLNLLSPTDRGEYLPRLEEFLKMDNERNWRFRLELSSQLSSLVSQVTPDDIRYHLAPIALSLVQDKVSCVRQS